MEAIQQLQAEMRQCRLCAAAGHDIVPGAVFSGGAAASVMLIGQAPGVTEVEARRPFNAGSGRRLFQWLEAAGWEEAAFRRWHYMTAVTKCYPGKGSGGKGDRVPSAAEQALCRPFLDREIALVQPRLMILVGKLAIGLLFPRSAPLRDLIGRAVYFPPESLSNPVQFDLAAGVSISRFGGESGGRYVLPLPHPSGASLWPNKPANRRLIDQAVALLDEIRRGWGLT